MTNKEALTQRIEDMKYAIDICVEPDDQVEALRSVVEIKWRYIPIPVAENGVAAIADYLLADEHATCKGCGSPFQYTDKGVHYCECWGPKVPAGVGMKVDLDEPGGVMAYSPAFLQDLQLTPEAAEALEKIAQSDAPGAEGKSMASASADVLFNKQFVTEKQVEAQRKLSTACGDGSMLTYLNTLSEAISLLLDFPGHRYESEWNAWLFRKERFLETWEAA